MTGCERAWVEKAKKALDVGILDGATKQKQEEKCICGRDDFVKNQS